MCFRLLTSAFVTVLINNIKNPDPAVFISSLSMRNLKKPKRTLDPVESVTGGCAPPCRY